MTRPVQILPGSWESSPVTLDNWQSPPWSNWGFSHVSEIVRTATISRELHDGPTPHAVPQPRGVVGEDYDEFMAETSTRALIVERGGDLVGQWYAPDFSADSKHLLMSVSKSVCGLLIGRLVQMYGIDLQQTIAHFIPQLGQGAFGNATVQQVLDMQVAVEYDETYHHPDSHVDQQDRVAGWKSPRPGDPADTYKFLADLRSSGTHGERFQYCSAATDVLAWLAEIWTGRRYPEIVSTHLWARLGCEHDALVTVDASGFAFANGGIACTARDLARVGRLVLDGGRRGDEQIVPQAWVEATRTGGRPEAAAGSLFQAIHPRGSYRNQWWATGDERGSLYAAGIHGQFIWVDPESDTVIVKFSAMDPAVSEHSSRLHAQHFRRLALANVSG